MKKRLLYFIFLLLSSICMAQKQPEYQLGFRYHYGFILVHVPSLQHFSGAHFPVYEITLTKLTYGNKDWQQAYHNPDLGMSFYVTDFGKNKFLGKGYALFPNITFHYLRKKWLHANFRIGAGLGYIEKPFERLHNYKNSAIGSHINSAISILIETKYTLNARTNLGIGVALNHFSNGATKTPNLGINMATANIALAYTFADRPISAIDSNRTFKKHFEYLALLCGGYKEIAPAGGNKYAVVNFSFNVARVRSLRGKWGGGIDIFHDASIKEQFQRDSISANNFSITQAGVNLSWEVIFGKVSFPLQAGVYAFSKYKGNGVLYNRYGVRYQFHKNLVANFSIKTHYAKADYFEWGIGYKWY